MDRPLEGLTVVEMAGLGPAPFACYLLAGLGARVIRIEAKGRAPVFLPLDPETNPDVLMRDIRQLDLKSDQDREVALQLIAAADVLVEGFRPRVMERLRLGPDAMLEANPRLVYARRPVMARAGRWRRSPVTTSTTSLCQVFCR